MASQSNFVGPNPQPPWLQSGQPSLDALLRLLAVTNPPRSGAGVIPAAQALVAAIFRFGEDSNRADVLHHAELLDDEVSLLLHSPTLPTHFRAIPDRTLVSPQYAILLNLADCMGRLKEHPEVVSAIGAVFVRCILMQREITATQAGDLEMVLKAAASRTQRNSPWIDFAMSISLVPEQVRLASSRAKVNTVREFGDWLATVIEYANRHKLPLPAITASLQQESPNPAPPSSRAASAPERARQVDAGEHGTEGTEAEQDRSSGSLVLWCFQRAQYRSGPAAAGLSDWNMLSPGELKRALKGVIASLEDPTGTTRDFAILAVVSLSTSLPIRLALTLSFFDNQDLWIDAAAGTVNWNLGKLVERESIPDTILASGYSPDRVIRLSLPQSVARLLSQFEGSTQSIGELLLPEMGADEVESRFGSYLRRSSSDDPRRPYSARFSCSLGAAILAVTGDAISAAYGALDFRVVSGAELNYLCISEDRISNALRSTYEWLDLGPIATEALDDRYVGSPLAPRKDVFRKAVTGIAERIAKGVEGATRNNDPFVRFCEYFNTIAAHIAVLFVLLTGERGSDLARRTVAAILGHPNIAMIFDKETSARAERPIPLTAKVQSFLALYLSQLERLSRRCRQSGLARLARRIEHIFQKEKPSAVVFIQVVRRRDGKIGLAPVTTDLVRQILGNFGMERNGGRHYWLSLLAGAEHPIYLRRVLSGHDAKAGSAFHAASGIPPVEALAELRAVLEAEENQCLWPAIRNTSPPGKRGCGLVRLAATKWPEDATLAAYQRNDRRNVGRPSGLFGLNSAAGYAHALELRSQFLRGTACRTPGLGLLLSLVLVEGLTDRAACRVAWEALVAGRSVRTENTVSLELSMPSGRSRLLCLTPPSLLLLKATVSERRVTSFEEVCDAVAIWAIVADPRFNWPNAGQEALQALCGVAQQLKRFEFAPWIVTAETARFGAASMSLSSLVRLLAARPIEPPNLPPSASRVARRGRAVGSVQRIVEILNAAANPDRKIGEERARKVFVMEGISRLKSEFICHFPMAEAVIDYVLAETLSIPPHGQPIEVGTIAAYVSSLARALAKHELESPLDFSEPGWVELQAELKQQAKERGIEFDPSPLRRFARYWRSQGATIPGALFAGGQGDSISKATFSAASHFVWRREFEHAKFGCLAQYAAGSIDFEICDAFWEVIWELPQRASESNFLRLQDLDEQLQQIVVTSSGFSHLKGGDKSRRAMDLSPKLCQQLGRLRRRLLSLSPTRVYFFFGGIEPSSDVGFVTIAYQVSVALRDATGEPDVRRHALRGMASCRRLWPEIECELPALLSGHVPIATSETRLADVGRWRSVVAVAAQAGHHPLTAITSYLTIWPFVAMVARLRILDAHWPGEGFCALSSIKSNHLRVLKHRGVAAGEGALPAWQKLAAEIDRDLLAKLSISLASGAAPLINFSQEESSQHRQPPEATIWCVGLLMLGAGATLACDLSAVSDAAKARDLAEACRRRLQAACGSSADGLRVMREVGLPLAAHLNGLGDLSLLRDALSAISEVDRFHQTGESELTMSLQRLLKVVPESWGLALLPEIEGLHGSASARLRAMCPRLIFKPPSKTPATRFRFTVTAPGKSLSSPRSHGAGTKVLEVLLAAASEWMDQESYRSDSNEKGRTIDGSEI